MHCSFLMSLLDRRLQNFDLSGRTKVLIIRLKFTLAVIEIHGICMKW